MANKQAIQKVKIDLVIEDFMNDWAIPLLDNQSRYLVLYGGAGGGKSIVAGQKIILRMLEEKGHTFLVVRKVQATIRNSCYKLLSKTIREWGLSEHFEILKGNMDITCKLNGNKIIFTGIDDEEKLKSIADITGMWLEEPSEMLEEDFQQLDLRLRGITKNYKQTILSFNPISITHWLKHKFFDNEESDDTYRLNSKVIHTTYKDNRFIDDEYKILLESYKKSDPYFYSVYCLGNWGVLGQTVFDPEKVTNRLIYLKANSQVLKRGCFSFKYIGEQIDNDSIRFVDDVNGNLLIYELPIKGYPYVIGGDIAEGGHDYSIGQCRNNITWNQAAVWRDRVDTDIYAKQMYCLGKYYNDALIGIEINFETHPVKELSRLHYPKQYITEKTDDLTFNLLKTFGFRTTAQTRRMIIGAYVQLVRDYIHLFNDIATLEEMLVFVRNSKGKPEAQNGMHDDLILADAICQEVRTQQNTIIPNNEFTIEKLSQDLQDDYWNATPQEREYLAIKWGLKKKIVILN